MKIRLELNQYVEVYCSECSNYLIRVDQGEDIDIDKLKCDCEMCRSILPRAARGSYVNCIYGDNHSGEHRTIEGSTWYP